MLSPPQTSLVIQKTPEARCSSEVSDNFAKRLPLARSKSANRVDQKEFERLRHQLFFGKSLSEFFEVGRGEMGVDGGLICICFPTLVLVQGLDVQT